MICKCEPSKAILRWSKKDADKRELGKMFAAVDESYNLTNQYKYTWNTLQNYGQLRDTRIWPNFLNFIEWMEDTFSKERFYEVMGKSYDLDDNVLIRCDDEKFRGIDQKWLISSMFRYVENPERDLMGKYVGKIRFKKVYGEGGEVRDIKITILDKNGQRRDYYKEDDSTGEEVLVDKTIHPPKWLDHDSSDSKYESLKVWDLKLFEFLKTKDFSKCQHQADAIPPTADCFEIDCSQLLGIGGEAVVIRLDKSKKVRRAPDEDSRDEAIKIIPIDKLPSEYQERVLQRQAQLEAQLQLQEEETNAGQTETERRGALDSTVKKLESIELNDNDAELAEFNSTNLKHPSLMDYSNVQLDFIRIFGEKKFVMVIVMPYYDASAWDYLKYAATQPIDFFPIQSRMKMTKRILDGIIYMHQNDTCHRDIKLRLVFTYRMILLESMARRV